MLEFLGLIEQRRQLEFPQERQEQQVGRKLSRKCT